MNITKTHKKPTAFSQISSGKFIDLLNPNPDLIGIEDIAHALSNTCRFNGHIKEHYSVAQHSVLVSYMVAPRLAFDALMHDATEAFLGDVSTPLKMQLPEYQRIEKNMHNVLAYKFGFSLDIPQEVKQADRQICWNEKKSLLPDTPEDDIHWEAYKDLFWTFKVEPLSNSLAKLQFLNRYNELTGRAS